MVVIKMVCVVSMVVPEEEKRHECACVPPWLPMFSCLRHAVLCADAPCHNNNTTCEDDGLGKIHVYQVSNDE